MSTTTTEFVPVTVKQVDFIATLTKQRNCLAIEAEVDAARAKVMSRTFSKREASKLIGLLLEQPRKVLEEGQVAGSTFKHAHTTAEAAAEPGDGIYYDEASNEIYKVYKAVHGSGRQCVKRLNYVDAGASMVADPKGTFQYLGLAAKHLPKSARLMTLDEAKKFGTLYGFCVRCGKTLTDEVSIANGIGPVCAGKEGWGEAPVQEDPNACSGGKCDLANLSQCTRHGMEYQNRYGRAYNE